MIWKGQVLLLLFSLAIACAQQGPSAQPERGQAVLVLPQGEDSEKRALRIDNLYFETKQGRTYLPAGFSGELRTIHANGLRNQAKVSDGRTVDLAVERQGHNFVIRMSAQPATDIVKWGLATDAMSDEYYTGLMERVVDGPQRASWEPDLKSAMDLRGQKVEMIVKPTTSIYAPFYLSSRGYGLFVQGTWPGLFDFAVSDPQRVKIEFEGSSLEIKVYFSDDLMELVRQHALDALRKIPLSIINGGYYRYKRAIIHHSPF